LQLWEEGRIELDAPITTYLPEELSRHFPAAGQVTVRMLLNHTSGLPEYNQDPYYVTTLLQHPDRFFAPEEYLQYISGKPLRFAPGSRFAYTNTNYELLALIADQITGDHAAYLTEKIFQPLGLTRTFYRHEDAYLTYPALYNAYWDRYSNGIVENVSRMQRTNVASMIGDDGLVCTPRDAVRFLRGLMEGELLRPGTLAMMQEWVKDEDGTLRYGLGLDHTLFHGQAGYGHSGGGLGAGCELYYLPANNTYFFLGINLGTVTASPIHRAAEPALEAIHAILAE
ncbi:MAG: beta-lactamase family protein, partial [Lewinella sp.]|nr:beta-lactamase family protein [Lewinella sp.]